MRDGGVAAGSDQDVLGLQVMGENMEVKLVRKQKVYG